jgi:hypothetical protein
MRGRITRGRITQGRITQGRITHWGRITHISIEFHGTILCIVTWDNGSPNTFLHNKHTLFKPAESKIAYGTVQVLPGILSNPRD